jgi:hypothetical protein
MSGGTGAGRHTGNGKDTSSHSARKPRFASIPERVWPRLGSLTKTEQSVLIVIVGFSNDPVTAPQRCSSVSLQQISDILGISRREVRRASKGLAAKGLLRTEQLRTEHGGFDRTRYAFEGGGGCTADRVGGAEPTGVGAELPTRKKEREHLEKNGAGAAPEGSNGNSDEPDPIKAALFDTGRKLLAGHCKDPHQAGALVGRWRKLVGRDGEVALLDLFQQVRRDRISEPIGYIEKALRHHAKRAKRQAELAALEAEFGSGYRPMPSAAGG